ncbi:hypothetical protein LV716_09725 [Flagellimonas sp. HMM57]|uniref:hypothetical protein n=1 Tax=unclassified Flagellimonas TaxID=2644544 RepID=UPI0013D3DCF4|nr:MULTISPECIES: hypothetical protein [unclassified Flagellimonas]UII74546.1 hypothetical protein LV716_09725 [Flagellimonas sp. HMM57]
MKKKERPAIFPDTGFNETSSKSYHKNYKVKLGELFKIGNPVNKSYLYIHDSVNGETSEIASRIPVHKIMSQLVVIIGILELSNKKEKVILERKDKNDFFRGQSRLYVAIDDAIISKELIPL